MTHHNFSMCRLLSVSMSRYRRNMRRITAAGCLRCLRSWQRRNVVDDAIQDENRNPYVRDSGAQTLGIQKVVPCPDIPEAPASPCNIIHCKSINCESKLHLESLIAECNVDYLLKNQKAEVHLMLSLGQKAYSPPASPVTASPSPEQRESRLFSTRRQLSSRKPKFPDLDRMR